jgi:lipopolysaccharide/colanic/teichoic acid biosynthesis glycosyltransferase
VGRFLRKSSIDEIPQFINVLIGNMSFIGPRPDTPDFLPVYKKKYPSILTIKPGITGYNQAYFRNSIDGNEKMKNDDFYARNISFIMDVKILLKTIKTVLFRENINH